MKILVINPGSTSTKIAVYENETPLFISNIKHSVEELSAFPEVIDQFEFRKNLVLQELENNKIPFSFDAIIGRGGLVKPIPGGVYEVNDAMKRDTVHAMRTHACNLGGLIASELAATLPDCPAFIADPGVVDELEDIARITGSPLMPKITIWHALNQKAIARRFALSATQVLEISCAPANELQAIIPAKNRIFLRIYLTNQFHSKLDSLLLKTGSFYLI